MISAALIHSALPGLRRVVIAATTAQNVVPTLAPALKFHGIICTACGKTDLIQAQWDFFGRHRFARLGGLTGQRGPCWD